MKCKVIYVDRGKALLKNGKYENTIGEFSPRLFAKTIPFYIPEKFRNITLENTGLFFSSIKPFFIIDAKSSTVLNYIQNPDELIKDIKGNLVECGINLTAEFDPTIALKLKVLIKTSFWEMLAKHLKLGLLTTLIYLGAGYGLFRFAEYAIRIMFLKQG